MLAVAIFTIIVLARGVAGHLDRALSGLPLWSLYLGMTVIAGFASWRLLSRTDRQPADPWPAHQLVPLLITSVCPLLTTLVLGRDMTAGTLTALWLLTLAIAGAHVWFITHPFPHRPSSRPEGTTLPSSTQSPPATSKTLEKPAVAGGASASLTPSEPTAPDEETFSQRWTRREGDMGDELEGILRIYFAVGQRTATADIPIVPAMASIPAVDCEPMHASDADVQVLVRGVHTYGVRLELQRPAHRDAAEEIEVAVLIHAERDEKFEV